MKTLRMMHEVRPFKLVFVFQVRGISWVRGWIVGEFLKSIAAKGLFDFLGCPPTVRIEYL